METNYNLDDYKNPCPRVDCRKEACKCGLKYVSIPSILGDDSPESGAAPKKGEYCNAIVRYEVNDHIYVYSKEGIPVLVGGEDISAALAREIEARIEGDEHLQQEIDELKNSPDVVDIVATYEDLMDYDTSKLGDNDVIRVLTDETHDNESSYYRWDKTNSQWVFIGAIEGYYTKDQTDALLDEKQDKLTVGSNINIDANNVISGAYTHFTGATASTDGVQGLVPGPLAGDEDKFLKADGTWGPAGSNYTAGDGIDITNNVISATNTGKPIELTSADYNWPTTGTKTSVATWLLEPGVYCCPSQSPAVQIGLDSTSISNYCGTFVVGDLCNGNKTILFINSVSSGTVVTYNVSATTGVRNSFYSLKVNDTLTSTSASVPLSANQGKVLKDLIDSLVISGVGAPTTTTVGVVGTLYEDTTNGELYQCTAIDTTDPQNIIYTWDVIGGGGGPTVVQAIGTSTTDVMSQNAVTKMIYPSTFYDRVYIGRGNGSATGQGAVAIGGNANTDAAVATGTNSVAIGRARATAFESVAFPGGEATMKGVFEVGLNRTGWSTYGYNDSAYRLISGVYDPQNAHDAATKGYVDTAVASAGANTISSQDWSDLWQ